MDALATIITTFPIPTLLVVAGVVLLGGLMRGQGTGTTVRHVAVALACYLFAFGLLSWAETDSRRLWLLVGAARHPRRLARGVHRPDAHPSPNHSVADLPPPPGPAAVGASCVLGKRPWRTGRTPADPAIAADDDAHREILMLVILLAALGALTQAIGADSRELDRPGGLVIR
jgi:hypothetical protein